MAAKCRFLNFVIVILNVSINFIVFSAQFYFSTESEVGMFKFMHNFVVIGIVEGLTHRLEDTLNIQSE